MGLAKTRKFSFKINQFDKITFKAQSTTCVLDLTATVAAPCLTASIAYSI